MCVEKTQCFLEKTWSYKINFLNSATLEIMYRIFYMLFKTTTKKQQPPTKKPFAIKIGLKIK